MSGLWAEWTRLSDLLMGLIREVVVAYRNFKESFDQLTNRAVRSLVRIFDIDEDCIQEDLAQLQKKN